MGILLGYSEVGCRVLLNNRIIVARHVDIVMCSSTIIEHKNESVAKR